MKNSQLKSAATIFGICLVGVFLLYLFLVFKPLYDKTELLNIEHQKNAATIKEYDTYIREKDKIEAEISGIEDKIKAVSDGMPLAGKEIANDINNGFMKSSILLKSISMTDEVMVEPKKLSAQGEPFYSVTASLDFDATHPQLMTLLGYFESKSKGAYYVTALNVSTGQEEKQSINLTLTAYYYAAQNKTAVKSDSGEPTVSDDLEAANQVFS